MQFMKAYLAKMSCNQLIVIDPVMYGLKIKSQQDSNVPLQHHADTNYLGPLHLSSTSHANIWASGAQDIEHMVKVKQFSINQIEHTIAY